MTYNSLKIFQLIVLLNTLFIKKVIGERFQFQAIGVNFIHLNQLGGLKQYLTTNTEVFLTYIIQLR